MSARDPAPPVDVALRDGSTVRIRPVAAGDVDALRELLGGMSDDSRWLRFMSGGVNLERAARAAAERADGVGLVATAGTPERIVAHAEFIRVEDDRAEVAFEVADAWHGRGLATILLAHLAHAAEHAGVSTFMAYVHPSNHRMVGVFRESGFAVEVTAEAGELVVELPASLDERARLRFEDRSRAAAVAAVATVLRPASVALAGDVTTPESAAWAVRENARAFTGTVHVIEAAAEAIEPVDLAVVAVPPDEVLRVARLCAAAGVRALLVLSGGFGADRAALAELLATCRSAGMRLVGPSSLGVANTDPDVRLNLIATSVQPEPGRIGLASQSGAIGIAAIAMARKRGLGLSTFVATGDKADMSGNDFLQFWEQDAATAVVLLYLESFGNPRRFARIARRVGAAKPIVAVKTGRAVAAATAQATYTRRLLSVSDVTVDALFAHAGVIRTETVAEQLDVAALLAAQPLPGGDRVAIVTNGRGPAVACAEACETAGMRVAEPGEALARRFPAVTEPGNLLDLGAGAAAADYSAAIELLAADGGVDAVVAIFVSPDATRAGDVAAALRAAAERTRAAGRPLLGVFPAAGESDLRALAAGGDVPLYGASVIAARALGRMAAYARWRRGPAEPPPAVAGIDADAAAAVAARALARGEGWLQPDEVHELLDAYGIPVVETRFARDAAEAGRCAAELAGPVAVKATAAGVLHRSDVGAVKLAVSGAEDAVRAAGEAEAALRASGHAAEGYVVQRMAPEGVELAAGVLSDPDFGPVVVCGAAGPAMELVGDVTVRLAPLTPRDAATMVGQLRTSPLLDGYRGTPKVDRAAFEDLLVRLSLLAATHAEIVEIDFDPVVVALAGVTVLDARVYVRPPSVTRPFPALDR